MGTANAAAVLSAGAISLRNQEPLSHICRFFDPIIKAVEPNRISSEFPPAPFSNCGATAKQARRSNAHLRN